MRGQRLWGESPMCGRKLGSVDLWCLWQQEPGDAYIHHKGQGHRKHMPQPELRITKPFKAAPGFKKLQNT